MCARVNVTHLIHLEDLSVYGCLCMCAASDCCSQWLLCSPVLLSAGEAGVKHRQTASITCVFSFCEEVVQSVLQHFPISILFLQFLILIFCKNDQSKLH